ncbi:MAG: hypothetical protein NUV53_01770, partial [Patescibacteria group bacterium]|nr:hypothetical protein [Patescibacteria group bacterium]
FITILSMSLAETRTCQSCRASFEIDAQDFAFYERVKVPAPTFCWKCRLARRLQWRNEKYLYKRECDLCKKSVISMYKPETPFPVYCHECWWSDKWDPSSYGKDYDFFKPFFAQFGELQNTVPKPAMYATDNVQSEYCNYTAHMKGGYLMFGSWFSEDCGNGQTVLESKDCWDCLFIRSCELCLGTIDSGKCYQTHFSQKCADCADSAFLYDCRNCQNCLFSWNLRSKSYHVWNKPVLKEEFEKIKKETTSSAVALEKAVQEFHKIVREQAVHKFMTGERNQNVSGEFIYNSKNISKSYYIHDGQDEKYAVRGGKGQKDAMDVFGVHAGELAYECNNIDFSSRALFCVNGENHLNTEYLTDSFNMKNSFGCISMRGKEYCILNKQYSKESFDELRIKIIEQMNSTPYIDRKGRIYKYGEMFPIEIIPHNYNETLAQDYVPITEERAAELGYGWQVVEEKGYTSTKTGKDLPDTIAEVDDSILNEIILCDAWEQDKKKAQEHGCTKAFRISANELAMYRKWNIPLPHKCPNTRIFESWKLRNLIDLYKRTCGCAGIASDNGAYKNSASHSHGQNHCPVEFETSYAPNRPETVYCEQCYQSEVA